jgi:hypothetical protein
MDPRDITTLEEEGKEGGKEQKEGEIVDPLEDTIHRSLQAFLDGLALDTAALVLSQRTI